MDDWAKTPEERDAWAGEVALGALDAPDRARAAELVLADPAFAAAVARWEDRLAPLLDELAPVEPARTLWPRIASRLGGARVVPMRVLRRWQTAAGGLGALAALLGLGLLLRPEPVPRTVVVARPAPPAPLNLAVAQLLDKQGTPLLAVGIDRASGRLRVRVADVDDGQRLPELWVIPQGGAPHSLGLIEQAGASEQNTPPGSRAYLRAGATLAVTLEPRAGAPHVAPSGAILTTAPLSIL